MRQNIGPLRYISRRSNPPAWLLPAIFGSAAILWQLNPTGITMRYFHACKRALLASNSVIPNTVCANLATAIYL